MNNILAKIFKRKKKDIVTIDDAEFIINKKYWILEDDIPIRTALLSVEINGNCRSLIFEVERASYGYTNLAVVSRSPKRVFKTKRGLIDDAYGEMTKMLDEWYNKHRK